MPGHWLLLDPCRRPEWDVLQAWVGFLISGFWWEERLEEGLWECWQVLSILWRSFKSTLARLFGTWEAATLEELAKELIQDEDTISISREL